MLCGTARVRLILPSQGSDTRAGWWAWCVPIVHPFLREIISPLCLSVGVATAGVASLVISSCFDLL